MTLSQYEMVVKGTDYNTESEALIERIVLFGERVCGWNKGARRRCDDLVTLVLCLPTAASSLPLTGGAQMEVDLSEQCALMPGIVFLFMYL